MKPKELEQVKELLKGLATVEEVAEVDTIIAEAKGKVLAEPTLGYWEGKTPCWEMYRCPKALTSDCPAFKYRSLACWAIEGTYCKLDHYGVTGVDTSICQVCRVYKKYGHGEPIEIKLFGKGLTRVPRSMAKEEVATNR